MTDHDIAERARLLSHQLYASTIDGEPQLLDRAREMTAGLLADAGATMGQELWSLILRRPWPEVRERMLADDAEGRLLRSNSPFSTLIGIWDPQERTRLWRQAKQDLSGRPTSSGPSEA